MLIHLPELPSFPAPIHALIASASIARAFTLRALIRDALRGASVGVILGDNAFDAYALARAARSAQHDPATILARIELSRAFTCYQLHHRVRTLDDARLNRWRALCITGLLDTFYDESVNYSEAARLLQEILARLKHIAANGLPVLITCSPSQQSTRPGLAKLVAQNIAQVWRIEPVPAMVQTDMFGTREKGRSNGTHPPNFDPTHSRV